MQSERTDYGSKVRYLQPYNLSHCVFSLYRSTSTHTAGHQSNIPRPLATLAHTFASLSCSAHHPLVSLVPPAHFNQPLALLPSVTR